MAQRTDLILASPPPPKAGVLVSQLEREARWQWVPLCPAAPGQTGGPGLTFQVLSSPGQEIVEDVEGPLILGLADSTRFLQKIFANIEEWCKLQGRQPLHFPLYARKKQLNFTRHKERHKMAK